jgi:hypothetical protein
MYIYRSDVPLSPSLAHQLKLNVVLPLREKHGLVYHFFSTWSRWSSCVCRHCPCAGRLCIRARAWYGSFDVGFWKYIVRPALPPAVGTFFRSPSLMCFVSPPVGLIERGKWCEIRGDSTDEHTWKTTAGFETSLVWVDRIGSQYSEEMSEELNPILKEPT